MNPVNEPRSEGAPQSLFRILHTEWSMGWGGQEQRILLECRKMEERGHRMLIACQPGSGILGRARACGLRTEEVVIRGSFDPRAIAALWRIIRRERIQVVNTHSGKDSWAAGFAAKLARADLLVRSRHLSVPISNNPLNFVYSMADGFITTGEAIRETMIGNNGIDPAKIISIPTGVSLGRFNPDFTKALRLRSEFGISADAILLTMVAVLRSMKRHDLFLRAAVELKQQFQGIRFLLVGEGPCRATIEKLIRDFGLTSDCILAGYRDDSPDILAASDIVALTSDRFEGVPQSLSQAMAMARPIVAAPVGSIEELVLHERTGLIAQAGNAESFARQIARLVADPALRGTLGKAAREHILASYTDDSMARRTEEFYWRLLERKRLRAAA